MDRRTFLAWMVGVVGGAMAAATAVPSAIYLMSPGWLKRKESWVNIADARGITRGEPVKVEYVQRKRDGWAVVESRSSAWVYTTDGKKFTAYDPHCTHLGCAYRFDRDRKSFVCPCHTAVFSVDGKVISGPPPRPLDRLPAKVIAGRLLILPEIEKGVS